MSRDRLAIDSFKAWMRAAPVIEYTGRPNNANKLAQPLPVYQAWAQENASFLKTQFGYQVVEPGKVPEPSEDDNGSVALEKLS